MSWWNSAITKSLAASLERFVRQLYQYRSDLNVEYQFSVHTYYCNSLTSLSLQYGQCWFIDCCTCRLGHFQLSWFIEPCDVCDCQQVFPHWAGPMLWWMAQNLMTNNIYDTRAACLFDSTVQIETPWRCVSGMIPSNRMYRALIHRSPPSMEYDL